MSAIPKVSCQREKKRPMASGFEINETTMPYYGIVGIYNMG